jgi:hypothetical protein
MMAECRLRGLWCRLYIPEDPDALDWAAFLRATAPYVDGWVIDPPFWNPGGLGPHLQAHDLDRIPELVARLPDYQPTAVRITGRDRTETFENVQRLEQRLEKDARFAQIFWLDTPLAYHGNRGLPAVYQQLGVLSHRPFVLENDPERVRPLKAWGRHVNLRTSVLKGLAFNPRVLGLIHHGSLKRVFNYAKAVVKRPDFGLMDGEEHTFLEYPSTTGVVSLSANLVPRLWRKLLDRKSLSARAGDTLGYMAVMKVLREGLDAIAPDPLQAVPWALYHLGLLSHARSLSEESALRLSRFLEHATD